MFFPGILLWRLHVHVHQYWSCQQFCSISSSFFVLSKSLRKPLFSNFALNMLSMMESFTVSQCDRWRHCLPIFLAMVGPLTRMIFFVSSSFAHLAAWYACSAVRYADPSKTTISVSKLERKKYYSVTNHWCNRKSAYTRTNYMYACI